MAKICELVLVRFGLLFNEPEVISQHNYFHETARDTFGYDPELGYTCEQLLAIHKYLASRHRNYRLVGVEVYDGRELIIALAWEQFTDSYNHEWIEIANDKIDLNTRLIPLIKIPNF